VSSQKRRVYDELINEVRRSQNATARFDQAVADALGMNRTDMRCVDVLQREGPMTAGRLAEETGLSTGAMTTALDRLERAGYARRVRDPADRRRVVVELTQQAHMDGERFYREHAAYAERLFERHTLKELEVLLRVMREGSEFNERRAAIVERETRSRQQSRPRVQRG
jgi:DNA-binding MarR family transcriptional regulator